jgi:hypothetical protein
MRKSALFAFAPLAAAGVIAGCGGSGESGGAKVPSAVAPKPGSTTGQDINQFGALWYVLTAGGTEVTHG